jgi:hypothetical protein
VRERLLNHEDLFRAVHTGNQAVLVPAQVEDQAPAPLPRIRRAKGLSYRGRMQPAGAPRDGEEPLQRLARAGVLAGESCGQGLPQDPHGSMFPLLGTRVKGDASGSRESGHFGTARDPAAVDPRMSGQNSRSFRKAPGPANLVTPASILITMS